MATLFSVADSPDSDFTTTIEGSRYLIKLRWNTRTSNWYLAVESLNSGEIQGYERVTINQPLVRANLELFAKGNLYVAPSVRSQDVKIDRYNFGLDKAYQLYYISTEELNNQ